MQRVPLNEQAKNFATIDSIGRWKERERKYTQSSQRNDSASKRRNGRGKHVAGHREGHTCCNYVTRRTNERLSLFLVGEKERERERARWLPATTRPAAHYSRSPRRATTIKTSSSSPLGWCMVSFTKRAVGRLRVQAFQRRSFLSRDLIMAGRWKWPAARIYI